MERKKKREGGGFYIAVCCCLVIIAAVGYANRMSLEEKPEEERMIAENAAPVQTPSAEIPPSPAITAEPVTQTENAPVSRSVKVEEKAHFGMPVNGEVTEEFSGDDLVYNEALKDWRAHSGIDLSADLGEKVLCSAGGTVEEVFDSNMGRCVIVNHNNGFKTMYANLNEDTPVAEGDELAEGDVIGTVGNTALGDVTDDPHLHFEMIKNGENVNPSEYME